MSPSLGGYILGVLNVSEAMIFCVWRTFPADPLEEVNIFVVWPKAPTDLLQKVKIFGVWRGAPTGLLDYCYY